MYHAPLSSASVYDRHPSLYDILRVTVFKLGEERVAETVESHDPSEPETARRPAFRFINREYGSNYELAAAVASALSYIRDHTDLHRDMEAMRIAENHEECLSTTIDTLTAWAEQCPF